MVLSLDCDVGGAGFESWRSFPTQILYLSFLNKSLLADLKKEWIGGDPRRGRSLGSTMLKEKSSKFSYIN